MEMIRGTPPAAAPRSPPRPVANNDPLPAPSRAKFIALQGAATDARDAAASASARHNDLRQQLSYKPEDAPGIEIEMGRLHAVRDLQNRRHSELASLCASIRHWLQTLPHGAALELAKPVDAKLLKGETLAQAIGRVRDEITSTRQHLRTIQQAPLPKADLKAEARVYVAGLAAAGRPHISGNRSSLSVVFGDDKSWGPMDIKSVMQMMAWLHGKEMIAALEKEIDALPEPPLALSAKEKDERLHELTATLDTQERAEEALIEQAIGAGTDVLRRTDASPLAVLGISFKAARVRIA